MPAWVKASFTEYQKRLTGKILLNLIEIPAKQNTGVLDEKLWQPVIAKLPPDSFKIALTPEGKSLTTEGLSSKIAQWAEHTEIVFFIGGASGLPPICLTHADYQLSLSKLTFPHMLVRVILAEQIYRAWTLLNNHPYHKK